MEAQCEANAGGRAFDPCTGRKSHAEEQPQLLSRSSRAEPGPLQSGPRSPAPGRSHSDWKPRDRRGAPARSAELKKRPPSNENPAQPQTSKLQRKRLRGRQGTDKRRGRPGGTGRAKPADSGRRKARLQN